MLTKLRSHLTYANVMATIAVFIALGGTSIAAVSLKKNSVGSTQLKKGAVRELRPGKKCRRVDQGQRPVAAGQGLQARTASGRRPRSDRG